MVLFLIPILYVGYSFWRKSQQKRSRKVDDCIGDAPSSSGDLASFCSIDDDSSGSSLSVRILISLPLRGSTEEAPAVCDVRRFLQRQESRVFGDVDYREEFDPFQIRSGREAMIYELLAAHQGSSESPCSCSLQCWRSAERFRRI